MSKVLKVVGTIAGVVATIAAFANPAGAILGTTYATIAAIGAGVSAVANTGAALLAKKPAARGNVNSVLIAAESPAPYLMGRTYSGGVLRHDAAWGGKVGKVQNPYRGMVFEYSVAGPVQALDGVYFDFTAIPFTADAATGYYATFLYRDTQLGATPESTALASYWASMPGWGSTSKLSGKAAILLNLMFDKDGQRYSGGVPQIGAVWQGVKVYDPHLDSTYPGGSGAHRITSEATWTYSATPALHALAYGYGRYYGGARLFGIGLGVDGLDIASFVAGANVEEDNGWAVGGTIFEPGDRWENLKNICAAGSATPVFSGGRLSYKQDTARVAVATIDKDSLAAGPQSVRAMQSYRDRLNTVIPKYRSEAHKWEYVAADAVVVAGYVTDDGEVKATETTYNLVQNKDQAAQLAAYQLVNAREFVIQLTLKPEAQFWQPGDMVTITLADLALSAVDAVLVSRSINFETMEVTATFISDDADKHAYALGRTGTAPPTPSLVTGEDRDAVATVNNAPFGYDANLIATSFVSGAGGSPITAADVGATATATVATHDRVYSDKTVSVTGSTVTGLAFSTVFMIYYDDASRAGGAVTYAATTDPLVAYNSPTYVNRHFVGFVTTPADGAAATGGGGSAPGGSGGGGNEVLP